MSGAILTTDGSEISLANPSVPAGATLTQDSYASLACGGVAVLSQWSASTGQGLMLSLYDSSGALTSSQTVTSSKSVLGANLIALAGGGVAVDWATSAGSQPVNGFDVYSATGAMMGSGNAAGSAAPTGFALPGGGFQLTWNGATHVYDATGHATTQAALSSPVVYANGAGGAFLELQDNQLLYFDGSAFQPAVTLPGEAAHAVTSSALATLGGGNIAAVWTDANAAYVAVYDTSTHTLSAPTLIDGGASGSAAVVALPDGGFAVSWTEGGQQKGEAFGANAELGPSLYLDGSVAGVTSAGELISVHQTTSGTAEQHYGLTYAPPAQPQTQYYNYLGQLMPTSVNNFNDVTHSVLGPSQGGATIYAPEAGPSGVAAQGGHNTIIASNGDNTYWMSSSDQVVVADGLTGTKTVNVWGSDVLSPGVNNLTFYGAQNYGIGNSGDNLIIMGGNDVNYMDGGAGNDVLVGGFGRNTFGVDAGNGNDVIYNFHWQDAVRLTGTSFTSFAQVQAAMTQVDAADGYYDVVLKIDPTETLTFRDHKISDFTASNFLLPLDMSQLGAMTFDDEFNSLQLLNTTDGSGVWRANFDANPNTINDYAVVSNQEKQLYVAPGMVGQNGHDLSAYNPFSIDNGTLDITAQRFSYADSQYTYGQAYASGMLNTKGLFEQKYGYFEMKAELPTDMGSWPAFWLSQDPFVPGNEADILEHLALDPNVVYARSNDNGWVNGNTLYMPNPSGFHTYGMLWTPTETTFYVDQIAVMQLATPASWDKPMYMILNLALGGWGGAIDQSGLPAQMKVDYVHVYGLADGSSVVDNMTIGNGYMETSSASYAAAAGINTIRLVGSHQTATGNDTGDTFISNDTGNTMVGGAGADFFEIGRGGDTVTGGGGSDTFAFAQTPWATTTITDFQSGQDKIDLTGLLKALNYTGSDPIADGYLKIVDDAQGDAQIFSDLDKVNPGAGWYLVTTLTGVHGAGLQAGDFIYSGGGVAPTQPNNGGLVGGGSPGSTGTGGSTGGTGSTGGGSAVSTSASSYTAPDGVTDITLTGSAQTVTGNNGGDTFHSNNNANHLIGGTGADVFDVGRGGDVVTGGGGADVFAFAETPWAGATITDFHAGQDKVDLSALLAHYGYAGTDPVADGWIRITNDGSGDAQIWSNLDKVSAGAGWYVVATLDGVASTSLQAGDIVYAGSGSTGGTTGGGTTGGGSTGSGSTGGGSAVSTSASSYTAPAGVTDITLTGSAQTVTGNDAGDTFHSNNTGNHLIGGTGSDTFDIGRAGDVVTGGGGADVFAFAETPWGAAHITDFGGSDKVDLTGLLAKSGYTGADPVGAGYVKITADGAGSAQIWSDLDHISPGSGWYLVTTLDGVATSAIQMQGDTVVMTGGATASGTTGPASVSTSASSYTAPAGVTDITLTGSAQTVTGNNAGDTFHSNNTGNHLIGGTGNDTFDIGRGGDVITGGAGSDTFAFAETPWARAEITDFDTAHDRIDLTGLLAKSGYAGTNAIADGYVRITDDGAGDAQVWSNLDKVSAGSGWYVVATVDHVSSTALHLQGAFIAG